MRTFTPRIDILPATQRRLWPELRPAQDLGFVLYGGTAVALRLGHRQSVDFDFFTEKPLEKDAIKRTLSFASAAGINVLQDQPDTYTLLTGGDKVKVSFFGDISFGRIGEPEKTTDGVLQVASFDDLLALKLKVLLQRVEAKDYRDIAALIRAGVSLERGLAGASIMFSPDFAAAEALKALVHFKGGDLDILSADEKRVLVTAVSAVRTLPVVSALSRTLAQ